MTATEALKTNLAAHITANMTGSTPVHISGTTAEISPPLIGISDTGSEIHEAGDTLMRGVYDIDLEVELATVPDETTKEEHATLAHELWCILASELPPHLTGTNDLTLFDFRADSGTLESDDGRRSTIFKCFAVACIEP